MRNMNCMRFTFFRLTLVFCFPDIMFRESALFGNSYQTLFLFIN